MAQLKILIVEDDAEDGRQLQQQLAAIGYQVCGIAASLREAMQLAEARQPDISIIDIYLQGTKDGIVFAEKINQAEDRRHPFIFLTNAADRTTFNLARTTGPFSYLLKPFNKFELQYAIELAVEKFAREEDGYFSSGGEPLSVVMKDVVFVKRGNILAKILVTDIRHIEVDGKYCKLVYGNDKFFVQKSLKQLQDQLPLNQFMRIHRNYIVNLKEISRINLQDHEIILQDGKSLLFSRRYLGELMQHFPLLK